MKLAELKRKFKNKYTIRIVAGVLIVAVLGSTTAAYNVYAAKSAAGSIPVGIGTEYDSFQRGHSFISLWDCSTSVCKSKGFSGPGPLTRYPRYSIFPSGPRTGE